MHKKWLWLLLLGLLCLPPLRAQEDEVIRENVSVFNIEVPVWVSFAGRPVIDLIKENFTLVEDGKVQEINGFQIVKKRIARLEEGPPAQAAAAAPVSRYFVLAFRVFDFNDPLQAGLKCVFDEILRPQDQLLVLINEKTRAYQDLADKEKTRLEIEADLRDQCHRAYNTLQANTNEFDEWIHHEHEAWQAEKLWASKPAMIRDFLQRYLDMMLLFKKRFLTQDIDQYYHFAAYLEKVKKEKWVLSFYQQEVLPNMKPTHEMLQIVRAIISECEESMYGEEQAYAVLLKQLLQQLETESKTGIEFPVEEISKLFMKVNATFHTLFINSLISSDSKNVEFRQILNGIQTNMRDLTEKTGGKLIASTDLVSSLRTIAETEDCHYVLTYSPANPKKVGKIKVRTGNNKHEVRYDDNQRLDYIRDYLMQKERENPSVKIGVLSLAERKLSLSIKDFSLSKDKAASCGWLKIRIAIKNALGKAVFDQAKAFKACSQSFSLSLDFPGLEAGKYDIIVDVLDQVSGKSCTDFIQPVIR